MEALKRQGRELEREIDQQLEQLEHILGQIDTDAIEVQTDIKPPEAKVQTFLELKVQQLKQVVESMNEVAASRVETSVAASFKDLHKQVLLRYNGLVIAVRLFCPFCYYFIAHLDDYVLFRRNEYCKV